MPQPLDSSKLDPTPPLLTQLYADVRWIKNTSLNSFKNLNYKSYYVLQIWFGKKHWIEIGLNRLTFLFEERSVFKLQRSWINNWEKDIKS